METNPITLFQTWLQQQLRVTTDKIPTACCLSTIGLDGFPNARFVSLKEVVADQFIVTGPVSSRKGLEMEANNRVALTFWWTETERQVRIQGLASRIDAQRADQYFYERSRESQIVSIVSQQGQELADVQALVDQYDQLAQNKDPNALKRPDDWGGYAIQAVRIEFLAFQDTRFHDRQLFVWERNGWTKKRLQP